MACTVCACHYPRINIKRDANKIILETAFLQSEEQILLEQREEYDYGHERDDRTSSHQSRIRVERSLKPVQTECERVLPVVAEHDQRPEEVIVAPHEREDADHGHRALYLRSSYVEEPLPHVGAINLGRSINSCGTERNAFVIRSTFRGPISQAESSPADYSSIPWT